MSIKQISIVAGLLGLLTFSALAVKDMSSVDSNTKETRDLYQEMQKEERGEMVAKDVHSQTESSLTTSSTTASEIVEASSTILGDEMSSATTTQ